MSPPASLPAHHFLLSRPTRGQWPASAASGWVTATHPHHLQPTFHISQRHLVQKTTNITNYMNYKYYFIYAQIFPLLFKVNSSPSRSSRSSLCPALTKAPPLVPIMERLDSVDWALERPGVGPRRGVAWRLRLDLLLWALLLGDPWSANHKIQIFIVMTGLSYIDHGLRLMLHAARLVAENINLVVNEQLVPLKLNARLGVSFANLQSIFLSRFSSMF